MTVVFTSILMFTPLRRFRWVYCQVETLRRCFPTSIRRTLDELPETLDATYEQSLRMIDKEKRDYAYRLFQCLVVSMRPLRVEELAELFAIQPDMRTIPTFDASLRPGDPEESVLSTCSTLVAVVNVDGQNIVHFSHFSVREYLISDRIANSEHVFRFHVFPRPAHALLARACLGVLLQLDHRIDKDRIRNVPLASYAAQYWVDHAQFENVSSDIQDGMECLFDENKPHFTTWLRLYNIDDISRFHMAAVDHPRPYAAPLYYAALCGFQDIAKHIVDAHPQGVNALGGMRVTPLHAALERGHLSVAKLLVKHSANIEYRDSRSWAPLHIASYGGHAEVVSLLVDRGADLNAEDFNKETPLHLASERGHVEIVRLLFDHGADPNHPDNLGRVPLYHASLRGHNDIVRLLIGDGANQTDNHGWTPLHHASLWGHNDTVQLLLDHGAVENHPDNRGRTPLHLASLQGHNDTVHLLLDRGAVVNHPDNSGKTPLYLASLRGHNDTVQLLLDHGAIANHSDKFD
jgi:ankyrin repeat protein